jgi:hypothetical protein
LTALPEDYLAVDSCVALLDSGLFRHGNQFLYCSIIVPHPPYRSNATYMAAVADLPVTVPEWVPMDKLHPNDRAILALRNSLGVDLVPHETIIHFRRVYFSMCNEADALLGRVLDALDNSGPGVRENTFVLMVSDHGENNIEHRLAGKNNMYDSASRVAMLLSGPGIQAGQVVSETFASLNDVYPTVLDMGGVAADERKGRGKRAGSSLLPLVNGTGDPSRKDYVVAQYHSVASVTGSFMLRRGDYKLTLFGRNAFDDDFQPQLFNLKTDPWELHDIASSSPDVVARLSATLLAEVNVSEVDARAKAQQRDLWYEGLYNPAHNGSGATGCQRMMTQLIGPAFDAADAKTLEEWLGHPCPFVKPGPPVPDPQCARGVLDHTGHICCTAACGVCAHPSSACAARPGGAEDCCPSHVQKRNQSCTHFPPPCVIESPEEK